MNALWLQLSTLSQSPQPGMPFYMINFSEEKLVGEESRKPVLSQNILSQMGAFPKFKNI